MPERPLTEEELALRGEILVQQMPPMPKPSITVSAEFSEPPLDVYADLRVPTGKSQPTDAQRIPSQKQLTELVLDDLNKLNKNCDELKKQMVHLVQVRLDALAGKTFGSFDDNKEVVDSLNTILQQNRIFLLYNGLAKEYRGKVVNVRLYQNARSIAGAFYVRLAEAKAKTISAENQFPQLKAAATVGVRKSAIKSA